MKFADVPIGGRFRFYGKVYTKIAPAMADDENRHGFAFGHTDWPRNGGIDGGHEVELIEDGETENPS